jgi:hypothetical protein
VTGGSEKAKLIDAVYSIRRVYWLAVMVKVAAGTVLFKS